MPQTLRRPGFQPREAAVMMQDESASGESDHAIFYICLGVVLVEIQVCRVLFTAANI
jgi:hypothetical protein